MAAKAMEDAGALSLQLEKTNTAVDHFKEASRIYQAHGSPDRAAECYARASRAIESNDPETSLRLLCLACDLLVEEHRGRFALDTFKKCVGIALGGRLWNVAVKYQSYIVTDVTPEMSYATERYRACLVLVIILLASGDEVEAGKRYGQHVESIHGYATSSEGQLTATLLDAWQSGDEAEFNRVIHDGMFINMDPSVIRLTRTLKLPGTGYTDDRPKLAESTQLPTSTVEVDGEDGDLC